MSELIDRRETINRFNVIRPVDPKKDEYTKGIDVGIAMCIVAVKDQPTIQHVATDTNVGNNSEIPNSSDCISRQQAIDIVVFECGKWTGLAKEISKQLKRLPPAQPEPQEGHWINGKCDLCGEHAPFWAMASTYHESSYCPNCGAKMKGATT